MGAARKLLVLDLDETLVHARETPLERPEDFRVGPYHVYRRPYLEEFVRHALENYRVAVWTSSGCDYAAQVVAQIFPADSLQFLWSYRRCTRVCDFEGGGYRMIKNLRKLKRQGHRLEHVIMIDDTPSKHVRNYGNLVRIREFLGQSDDRELLLLMAYLPRLAQAENVRAIEKRHWRTEVSSDP